MRMTGVCAREGINAERIRGRSTTEEKPRGAAVERGENIGGIVIERREKETLSGREIGSRTFLGRGSEKGTFSGRGSERGTFIGMIGRGTTLK